MKKIKKSDLSLNKDIVAILTLSETKVLRGAGVESNNTLCLGCAQATFGTVCLCDASYFCESELTTGAQVCCFPDVDTTTIKPISEICDSADCVMTQGCIQTNDCVITTNGCASCG